MRFRSDTGRQLDSVILLFLFALFLLISPFTFWWATNESPWFLPYLLWFGLILLIVWAQPRRGEHDL